MRDARWKGVQLDGHRPANGPPKSCDEQMVARRECASSKSADVTVIVVDADEQGFCQRRP